MGLGHASSMKELILECQGELGMWLNVDGDCQMVQSVAADGAWVVTALDQLVEQLGVTGLIQ